MKTVHDLLQHPLQGKKILVRVDVNVPLNNQGKVEETSADRIHKIQPTLDLLVEAGARVILISHIGRNPQETLQPVADYMHIPLLPLLTFTDDLMGDHTIVMLENLRSQPGEELNDLDFAHHLAGYADVYVNEAFSVSHRAHASVVGVPKYLPAYAGIQFMNEVEHIHRVLHPEAPALLIMGGAKFETKLPVIEKLLPQVDHVLMGGALANTFFKYQGYDIGDSLFEENESVRALVNHPKILLPERVTLLRESRRITEQDLSHIQPHDVIMDIHMTPSMIEAIDRARTIIWNGPMGNYEKNFTQGTVSLIKSLVKNSQVYTLVGGGDSVTLIEQLHDEHAFSFISTAGGALLEYLAQGTLPGIDALADNH